MKSVSARRAAFSLVEVLVALVVFSVGIYSVAGVLSSSQRTAAGSDYRLQGSGLAQLKLEELKSSPAVLEAVAAEGDEEVRLPADGPKAFEQNNAFSWSATVRRHPEPRNRLHLQVDVTRSGGGGANVSPPIKASGFIIVPTTEKAEVDL